MGNATRRSSARWAAAVLPLALLPALLLSSCTGSPDPGPSPTASTRADGSRPFGDSFLYGTKPGRAVDPEHALRVAVADLGTYTPGAGAKAEGHHAAFRQYRIIVTNTTDATWDLGRFTVVGLDDEEPGDRVIDTRKGIGVPPPERLPPGRTASWVIACSDDEGFPAVRVVPRNGRDTFPAALFKP